MYHWLACEAHLRVEVGDKLFEYADVDMFAFLAEHAVALALPLVCADTSADSGEVAFCVDYAHGIADVAHGELVYPFGNVVSDRTALPALRYLAVEAALGLGDGLSCCI